MINIMWFLSYKIHIKMLRLRLAHKIAVIRIHHVKVAVQLKTPLLIGV